MNTHPFSDEQQDVLNIVAYFGAVVSTLACIFIIASYVVFPVLRSFPYKLIAYLSLADLISSCSYLLTFRIRESDHLCLAQAILTQYFTLSTFFWADCFCLNIMLVLVFNRSNVEEFEVYYHLFAWGTPGLLLVLNVLFNDFGEDVVWCWITQDHEALRLVSFYLPMLLSLLFAFGCYVVVARSLRGDLKEQAISRRLRLYLLVFVIVRLWSVLNRLQNFIDPNNPMFELYLMHAIFSPLQGFFNVLAYGFNQKVRQHYYLLCCGPKPTGPVNVNAGMQVPQQHISSSHEHHGDFLNPQLLSPNGSKHSNHRSNSDRSRSIGGDSEMSETNSRGAIERMSHHDRRQHSSSGEHETSSGGGGGRGHHDRRQHSLNSRPSSAASLHGPDHAGQTLPPTLDTLLLIKDQPLIDVNELNSTTPYINLNPSAIPHTKE